MPSKSKRPLSDQELDTYEAGRDLAADLLQSIQEMKAGQTQVVHSPAIKARQKTGLSPEGARSPVLQGGEVERRHWLGV